MTAWLRRAGRGALPEGGTVVWSVAEGERGRRWRWTLRRDGVVAVGLVELRPDGTFARLEWATADRLLTFHPAPGGREAYGNVVEPGGVRHIGVVWQPGWSVGFVGDAFGCAVAGWRGSGLVVGPEGWRPPGDHPDLATVPVDDRGVPRLDAFAEWSLEVSD
jgi:hypothetical protein